MLTIFSTVFSVYWSRRPSSSFCLRAAGTHAAARRDVHWANYRRNQQQLNWPPMCEVNSQWSGTRDDHLHGAEWVGSACELQTACWQCFPWMSLLPANPIDLLHGGRRQVCHMFCRDRHFFTCSQISEHWRRKLGYAGDLTPNYLCGEILICISP